MDAHLNRLFKLRAPGKKCSLSIELQKKEYSLSIELREEVLAKHRAPGKNL